MARQVTEDDLRLPEFKGATLSELEFRADGSVARKDRWENAVRSIACNLGISTRSGFEVSDVVTAVRDIAEAIHYPQCWDTMAYPTLLDAIKEHGCNPDNCTQT